MNLEKACKNTALAPYVKEGLTALANGDIGHIEKQQRSRCHQCANFEKYVKESVNQNVPTWDYLVSVGTSLRYSETDALEVHRCEPEQVATVLAKLEWSDNHLRENFPDVDVQRWIWIASGSVGIVDGTPESFQLAQSGITLVSKAGYRP